MTPKPDIADRPARILIVDDERHSRSLLAIMLAQESFEIMTAASGEEALALMAQHPPDIVLLDIMMPGVDGYQVTRRMKGDVATRHIPVIMVTALDDRSARMRGLEAGAEDSLTKPVDPAELCVRVRNLLRLKAYGDYRDRDSQTLEAEVTLRTADLLKRTRTLEQQTAEQAALLDLAPDAIVVSDMRNRILFWNRGAEVMYGWPAHEALGQSMRALLGTEFSSPAAAIDEQLLSHGLWEGEVIHHKRDGTPLVVASRWALQRDREGVPTRVLTIHHDITERKRTEADLRTTKNAAEAANRAKSEFLANMSHEIRTPMNGVIGMTNLVLDTQLLPEQREYLEIVKSSAEALLTVINDILDLSRIEAGKLELDPIEFTTRDTIADSVHIVALRAHEKGLTLIVNVDASVPRCLTGDPGRLRQILVNLLGNAIKFTHQGEVVLEVTSELAAPPDIVLHFSIRDTGVGIPLERQESVFAAFTQADGSMTRTYGGTGLGLTISRQLVELMGGRLWVESAPGSGSTFHFTAHFAVADAPVTLAPASDIVDLQEMAVLVVDSNATRQRLLNELLIGWGMIPTPSGTMPDAIAALRTAHTSGRPFPLVLTDFEVPGSDGFELAETIKKDPAIADVTVVMLTSAGRPGDAGRCRELGIAAYLPRPMQPAELRGAIMLALGVRSIGADRPVLVTRHVLREIRQTGRILLVEDNLVNQLVARRLLEKRGHTVVVANNGRQALTILAEAVPFGCVLMDVQMPEMGGFECTAFIRAGEKISGLHLPIIAMTAHALKGDDARCLAAGMDAYLSKPIAQHELFDVVDRQLRIGGYPAAGMI